MYVEKIGLAMMQHSCATLLLRPLLVENKFELPPPPPHVVIFAIICIAGALLSSQFTFVLYSKH